MPTRPPGLNQPHRSPVTDWLPAFAVACTVVVVTLLIVAFKGH